MPQGPKIHPSQLLALGENGLTSSANISSPGGNTTQHVTDYAGFSTTGLNLIEENAQIAQLRYGTDIQFIISDHFTTTGPEELVIPSAEQASNDFQNSNADVVYWIHFNADNSANFEVKVNNLQIHSKLQASEAEIVAAMEDNIEFAAVQDLSQIKAGANSAPIPAVDEDILGSEREWYFGVRPSKPSENGNENENEKELNFWGLTKEIAGITKKSILKGEVADEVWKAGDYSSETKDKLSIFEVPGAPPGIVNGVIDNNPIAGTLQMIDFGKTLYKDEQTRKALAEATNDIPKFASQILSEEWKNYSAQNGKKQQHYSISKTVTTTVIATLTGTGIFAIIKNLGESSGDAIRKIRELVDDFPDDLVDAFYTSLQKNFPDAADVQELIDFMGELTKAKRGIFIKNPEFLDYWKKFKDTPDWDIDEFKDVISKHLHSGTPEFYAKFKEAFAEVLPDGSISSIKPGMKDFISDLQNSNTIFADLFKNRPSTLKSWNELWENGYEGLRKNPDAVKALDDAFTDGLDGLDALEDAIEVVGELNWQVIKTFFKRGNDFNAKGRLKYEYNEINLTTSKRLDSYIPGVAIISRKATTLNEISINTFERYLKELTSKYKKGQVIRSDKYKDGPGAIDGLELSGDYFLEIPSTNKTFFDDSQELMKLAMDYDVKIKYLDE